MFQKGSCALSLCQPDCVRHLCQDAPGEVAPMASTRPRCASEVTSRALVRPRAVAGAGSEIGSRAALAAAAGLRVLVKWSAPMLWWRPRVLWGVLASQAERDAFGRGCVGLIGGRGQGCGRAGWLRLCMPVLGLRRGVVIVCPGLAHRFESPGWFGQVLRHRHIEPR